MSLAETRLKIASLYREDAQLIACRAMEFPLVVVRGPMRMGKTTTLLPLIANCLSSEGVTPVLQNFQELKLDFGDPDQKIDAMARNISSQPGNKVVLGDEGGYVSIVRKESVEKVVKAIQSTGSKLTTIIPYRIGAESDREKETLPWLESQYGDKYPDKAIVDISTKYLPRQLAEELLSEGSMGKLTERQIFELLTVLPPHPWILDSVAELGTLDNIFKNIGTHIGVWLISNTISLDTARKIRAYSQEYATLSQLFPN
jgi:hypothetical protein